MADSKGKLRHIPACVLGMRREEEQAAPPHGVPVGASLRSRTLRQLCPGLLLAVSWSPSRASRAVRAVSQQPPATKAPFPDRSSWPYLLGASLSLRRAGPDTAAWLLLISALTNHRSLTFLTAANFSFDARALALPQMRTERGGTSSITSSTS